MKKLVYFVIAVSICLLSSCKKDSYTNATVVKVCGIHFLRVLDKEYKICNAEKTSTFENNQKVFANFHLVKNCGDNRDQHPVCALVGPGDGWINIIDIKMQ